MHPQRASLLTHRHDGIEAAAHALVEACMVVDEHVLSDAYRDAEHLVRAHLADEEHHLLPAYERAQPEDAQLIRIEHEELRRLLDEIAMEAETHELRPCSLGLLAQRLYAHARHEDDGMYAWLEVAPPSRRREIVAGILRSLQDLARVRARFARPRRPASRRSRDMRE
jgi:hypothetical protein